MNSRINWKFVIILAVILGVLGSGAGGVYWMLNRKDPKLHLKAGDEALKAGDVEKAISEYMRAIGAGHNDPAHLRKVAGLIPQVTVDRSTVASEWITRRRTLLTQISDMRLDDAEAFEERMAYDVHLARETGQATLWIEILSISEDRLRLNPGFLPARKYHALAQIQRIGDIDVARQDRLRTLEDLKAVLEADPEDTEAAAALARWYLMEAATQDRVGGDRAKAAEYRALARDLTEGMLKRKPEDIDRMINHMNVLLHKEIDDRAAALALAERIEARAKSADLSPRQVRIIASQLLVADRRRSNVGDGAKRDEGIARAVTVLEDGLGSHPKDAKMKFVLAQLLTQLGQVDKSMTLYRDLYQRPISASPVQAIQAFHVQAHAGIALADQLVKQAQRSGDATGSEAMLQEAEAIARSLEKQIGKNPHLELIQGQAAFVRKDWAATNQMLIPLLEKFRQGGNRSQYAQALLCTAWASLRLNETGAAADRFQALLAIAPDNAEARYQLILLHILHKDYARAQALLDQQRAMTPGDSRIAIHQAGIYARTKREKDALAVYAKVDFDKHPTAILPYTSLLVDMDRRVDAIAVLTARLREAPADPMALRQLIAIAGKDDPETVRPYLAAAAQAGASEKLLAGLTESLKGGALKTDGGLKELESLRDQPIRYHLARCDYFASRGQVEAADKELALAAAAEEGGRKGAEHAGVVERQFERALSKASSLRTPEAWADAQAVADRAAKLNLDQADGDFYRGLLLLRRGEYRDAVTHFRRGLGKREVHSDGHRFLGDALRLSGEYSAAREAYEKSLSQRPNNLQALLGLARCLETEGRGSEALSVIKRALEMAPSSERIFSYYVQFEQRYGDRSEALAMRKRRAQEQPSDLDNRRNLALLLGEMERFDEAVAVIDALIEVEPRPTVNRAVKARLLVARGDVAEGRKLLLDRLKELGDEATRGDWLQAARFMRDQGMIVPATQAYRQAGQMDDKGHVAIRELADMLAGFNQHNEAAGVYLALQKAYPDEPILSIKAVESLTQAGRLDDAEQALSAIQKKLSGQSQRQLLPVVLIGESKILKRRAALLRSEAGKLRREGQLAKAVEIDHQAEAALDQSWAKASEALKYAADSVAMQGQAYFHRAMVGLDLGRTREAREDLQQAVRLRPNLWLARRALAAQHLREGNTREAIRTLLDLVNEAPEHERSRLQAMLADAYMQARQWDQAERVCRRAAKQHEKDPQWLRRLASIAQARKMTDQVIQYLRAAHDLEATPTSTRELCDALLRADRAADVLELLRKHVTLLEQSSSLQATRGRALAKQQKTAEAKASFKLAMERADSPIDIQRVAAQIDEALGLAEAKGMMEPMIDKGALGPWLDLTLGQLEGRHGKWSDAAARFARLERDAKGVFLIAVLQQLSQALHRVERWEACKQAYERLLKLQPNNAGVLNNLAYLLAENLGKPEKGLEYARQAERLMPDSPNVLDTLGWTQYLTGKKSGNAELIAEALRTLRRSVAGQAFPANCYHLACVEWDQGNRPRARDMLKQAEELSKQYDDESMLEACRRLGKRIGG